jgi:ferredoxin
LKLSGISEAARYQALSSFQVVPDNFRCVQCGICSYNCPIGIDVRRYAWLGKSIRDSHCLTCGECIARCPRGVLQFESMTTQSGGDES